MIQPTINSYFRVTKRTAVKRETLSLHSQKKLLQHNFTNQKVTKPEQQNGNASNLKLGTDDVYKTKPKSEPFTTTAFNNAVSTIINNEKTIDVDKAEQRTCARLLTPPDTPITKTDPTKPGTAATVKDGYATAASELTTTSDTTITKVDTTKPVGSIIVKLESATVASDLTKTSKEAPMFLTLPPEIRNVIYGYLLGGTEYHVYIPSKKPVCTPMKPTDRQLLLVCKQICYEAKLLPISLNVFYVWPHAIERWLFAENFTSEQEDAITQLRFNWHEATRSYSYLEWFCRLNTVHITYVPYRISLVAFGRVVEAMRYSAGKEDVRVMFWRNEIGEGQVAVFT